VNIFSIDFSKVILWLLPHFLRRPRLFSYLSALSQPVCKLYDEFHLFRDDNLYRLSHTGQVFSLENVLNDKFDAAERRIYITDGTTRRRTYLFTRIEVQPEYIGKINLHNRGDYADTGVDFIVWIPLSVYVSNEDTSEAKALVNFYKLAGKRYKIYRV
jgi:hypothetical protein